jgi:hypothetical protein
VVAAMAVRFGSAEKKRGKGGKRGVLVGCTMWREEVGAWSGVACGAAEGEPWHQQPTRPAGAISGRAVREAEEWGGTCGPCVQAWANQGREGAGPGLRVTVPILI